jgi:hypothetical protein
VSRITRSVFPRSNLRIVFSAAGLMPLVNIWYKPHLARLGLPASYVASTAAKSVASANPMALVLFHGAAQLANNAGASTGRNSRPRR